MMMGKGLLLALAIVAGLAYPLSWEHELAPVAAIACKGLAVSLLALWCAVQARNFDGWLLTGMFALYAIADMALVESMTLGAIVFMAGHAAAIWLYLRNRRIGPAPSQKALGLLVMPATVMIAYALPADRGQAPGVALYALFVAAMAGTAWLSRFPRYRTGIGAMLFVASDLLIFARMGPFSSSHVVHFAIWYGYVAGQVLIAIGGVEGLRRRTDA